MTTSSRLVFEDKSTKRRSGISLVERQIVNAVLFDGEKRRIGVLRWEEEKGGYRTFVMGGVEPGETAEQAALREIIEETGFEDVEVVTVLGEYLAFYYAAHKYENRKAPTTVVLCRLRNRKRREIKPNQPHDFLWLNPDEVSDFLRGTAQQRAWVWASDWLGLFRDERRKNR